jgi:hypothetical protein
VALCGHLPVRVLVLAFRETDRTLSWSLPHSERLSSPTIQTLQDPILQLSWVCTRLSNPKSGVDLSFINDLFNKIASNNQHAHNGLLQSVKVPLPLLPAWLSENYL